MAGGGIEERYECVRLNREHSAIIIAKAFDTPGLICDENDG